MTSTRDRIYIDGAWVPSTGTDTLPVTNPFTEEVIGTVPEGTPEDVVYEFEKYPEARTEKDLERHVASAVRWHMKDLLDRTADRGRPVADIEQGYMSTASCILANHSMKLGRTLAWDPQAQQVINDDQANRLLKRPYRSPWTHPADKA